VIPTNYVRPPYRVLTGASFVGLIRQQQVLRLPRELVTMIDQTIGFRTLQNLTAMSLRVVAFTLSLNCLANAAPLAKDDRMYSQVIGDLMKASVPIRELHGRGYAAVTLAAGRVVALAFSKDGPNLLWSNPELENTNKVKTAPEKLVGGYGGDRLWFSPELSYHWNGKPDWRAFSNYHIPTVSDPGQYAYVDEGPDVVAMAAKGRLPVQGKSGPYLEFSVERKIRMAAPPLAAEHPLMRGVDYVGLEATQRLTIADTSRQGEMDLWYLLQTPVGSVLIVPLRPGHKSQPLSYGLPGGWQTTENRVIWRIGGTANAKVGIASEALTGRSAVLRKLSANRWSLMVRQFPVDTAARYLDHPEGIPRNDQVFQAWDGFGFGEMEYHSPALDAAHGPRALNDENKLWAFGGSGQAIEALSRELLGVDITDLLSQDK
jgi:hypothetical protein